MMTGRSFLAIKFFFWCGVLFREKGLDYIGRVDSMMVVALAREMSEERKRWLGMLLPYMFHLLAQILG